jgi:hypothetical protein
MGIDAERIGQWQANRNAITAPRQCHARERRGLSDAQRRSGSEEQPWEIQRGPEGEALPPANIDNGRALSPVAIERAPAGGSLRPGPSITGRRRSSPTPGCQC